MLQAFAKILILTALASPTITIEGHVMNVTNGVVEVRTKSGVNRLLMKKMSPDMRAAVNQAMVDHKDVMLSVTPEMVAEVASKTKK